MFRTPIFSLLILATLTGCATQKAKRMPVTPQAMSCSGGIPAQITLFSPDEAKLVFEDKSYALNRIETASGVKYGNRDIQYWNKGIDAMITRGSGAITTCTMVPKNGL